MVDDDDLTSAEQLLRDGDRANGIDCATASIADNVSVALLQAENTSGVESGVHTSQD